MTKSLSTTLLIWKSQVLQWIDCSNCVLVSIHSSSSNSWEHEDDRTIGERRQDQRLVAVDQPEHSDDAILIECSNTYRLDADRIA